MADTGPPCKAATPRQGAGTPRPRWLPPGHSLQSLRWWPWGPGGPGARLFGCVYEKSNTDETEGWVGCCSQLKGVRLLARAVFLGEGSCVGLSTIKKSYESLTTTTKVTKRHRDCSPAEPMFSAIPQAKLKPEELPLGDVFKLRPTCMYVTNQAAGICSLRHAGFQQANNVPSSTKSAPRSGFPHALCFWKLVKTISPFSSAPQKYHDTGILRPSRKPGTTPSCRRRRI